MFTTMFKNKNVILRHFVVIQCFTYLAGCPTLFFEGGIPRRRRVGFLADSRSASSIEYTMIPSPTRYGYLSVYQSSTHPLPWSPGIID